MKLLIAGDFCPRDRVANKFKEGHFSEVLSEVHDIVNQHNYTIVNEECPIVDEIPNPITKFCSNLSFSKEGLEALKYVGFDCLTLANNHFKDYGEEGVRQTLIAAHSLNFDVVGGGMSLSEAQKVLYKIVDGVNLAIVNICEHEFSIATETSAGSAPLDLSSNYYQIKEASENADFVIVIIHGGHEHFQLPSPRMKRLYRLFVDWGADVVVNHHQHCFSGYETYKEKYIFYGLGNFCFDSPDSRGALWNEGILLSLNINEDRSCSFEIIPYSQCDDKPVVKILKGSEKEKVLQQIESLNTVILDENKLQISFNDYCKKRYEEVVLSISPYSGRILKGLCRRGIVPSFNTIKRIVKLRNFVQCESHRDVLNHYLDNSYFEYEKSK